AKAIPRYRDYKVKAEGLSEEMWAVTLWRTCEHAIFLQRGFITHRVIAHEIHHVQTRLFADIGHKPPDTSDEPAAYLVGYITGWLYGQLKRHGVKVGVRE